MTDCVHDGALVSAYAGEGCESAFRSLVERHVNLVFATALRQVGERAAAILFAHGMLETGCAQ